MSLPQDRLRLSKTEHQLTITPKLYQYILSVSIPEHESLKKIREETTSKGFPAIMMTSPDEVNLLQQIIRLANVKNIIEVGVFTGYSSLGFALALPDDGKIVACDVSEEWTSVARKYWKEAGVENKIDLRIAPGVETLDKLLAEGKEGQFDFAYIDADKTNYDNYYEKILKLLRKNGVIAVDNTLWHGTVVEDANGNADTLAIQTLNQKIAKDDRVFATLVGIADGVTIVVKK